jgi:hypothetical protein
MGNGIEKARLGEPSNVVGCSKSPEMNTNAANRTARKASLLARVYCGTRHLILKAYNSGSRKQRLSLSGLNHWRKNYVGTRIVIYLLIGAYALSFKIDSNPASINSFMRYICLEMEIAIENPYYKYHSSNALAGKKIRDTIKAYFDSNKDGILDNREIGRLEASTTLTAADINNSIMGVERNLRKLVDNGHALHILPVSVTTTSILRNNLHRAIAEDEIQHKQFLNELEPYLKNQFVKPEDYLKWKTWKRGAWCFFDATQDVFRYALMGVNSGCIPWDWDPEGYQGICAYFGRIETPDDVIRSEYVQGQYEQYYGKDRGK